MEIFDSFFERDTDPNSGIVWKLRGISSEDAQKFCHSLAQNPENKDMLESFLYTALFFMPDTQEFWYMRAILLLNPVNGLPRSYYYSQAMASLKHARTCDMYLFEETMDGINGWQDFLIGRARRDSPYLLHDKLYQPEEPKPNTSRRVAIRDGGYISSEDAEKACHSLGSVDISTEPDKRGDKTQKSKIADSQLLETREDTTIPFYLVDETFNQMSLFVYMFVICSLSATITSRRYHRHRSIRLNNVNKTVRIVSLVCNNILTVISNYQRFGFSYVVSLTGG